MIFFNINNNKLLLTKNTSKEEIIQNSQFKIDILEKDGSYSKMCGNGCIAMCMKFKKNLILFNGLGEKVLTEFNNNFVKLKMNVKTKNSTDYYVNGEPHKVFFVENYDRNHHEIKGLLNIPEFNTTYIFKKNNFYYYSTFERGVNNITHACGTGAFAAITYLFNNNLCEIEDKFKLYTLNNDIYTFKMENEILILYFYTNNS